MLVSDSECLLEELKQGRQQVIITALASVTEKEDSLAGTTERSNDDTYYTLTSEEVTALVSGDIERTGSWLVKLDWRHANWLLRQIKKENGNQEWLQDNPS